MIFSFLNSFLAHTIDYPIVGNLACQLVYSLADTITDPAVAPLVESMAYPVSDPIVVYVS